MTDEKEERRYGSWTFEEYVLEQEKKEHHSRAMHLANFRKLNFGPPYTDEHCPYCGDYVPKPYKAHKVCELEARVKELADAHCTCEKCGQSHAGCLTLCPRCMSDRERA